MGDTGTKRRKWDVAAPAGVPAKSRAGVGNAGVTGINHPAYGGPAVDQLPTGISLSRATNNTSAPAAWFAPGSAASSVPKVVLGDARNKPLDDDAIRRIQQSALDVVAKLNQDLVAKGILPAGGPAGGSHTQHHQHHSQPASHREERNPPVFREVCINEAQAGVRAHLIKRSTMSDIERRWSVLLSVRGRYYPPGTPEHQQQAEKPLCLRITPGGQLPADPSLRERHCSFAASDVVAIISGTPRPEPASLLQAAPAAPYATTTPGGAYPPGSFPTAAPPPGALPYPTPQAGPYAVTQGQYAPPQGQYQQYPPPAAGQYPPPSQGGQQHPAQPLPSAQLQQPIAPPSSAPPPSLAAPLGPGPYPSRGPGFFCLYLGFDAPPEFDTTSRVRGPGGSYLQHIESTTGVAVRLEGRGSGASPEGPEPLHVRVSSPDTKAVLEAVKLAGNLIDTIRDDFKAAHPTHPPPPPSGNYDPPTPALPPHPQPAGQQPPPWEAAKPATAQHAEQPQHPGGGYSAAPPQAQQPPLSPPHRHPGPGAAPYPPPQQQQHSSYATYPPPAISTHQTAPPQQQQQPLSPSQPPYGQGGAYGSSNSYGGGGGGYAPPPSYHTAPAPGASYPYAPPPAAFAGYAPPPALHAPPGYTSGYPPPPSHHQYPPPQHPQSQGYQQGYQHPPPHPQQAQQQPPEQARQPPKRRFQELKPEEAQQVVTTVVPPSPLSSQAEPPPPLSHPALIPILNMPSKFSDSHVKLHQPPPPPPHAQEWCGTALGSLEKTPTHPSTHTRAHTQPRAPSCARAGRFLRVWSCRPTPPFFAESDPAMLSDATQAADVLCLNPGLGGQERGGGGSCTKYRPPSNTATPSTHTDTAILLTAPPPTLLQAPPKLPPYAAQYQQQCNHPPAAQQHSSPPADAALMGPPPPRTTTMGPPPPRQQPAGGMGPPPPRPANHAPLPGMVLPGMEAYTD